MWWWCDVGAGAAGGSDAVHMTCVCAHDIARMKVAEHLGVRPPASAPRPDGQRPKIVSPSSPSRRK